jgi:hypothetical protein
MGPYRLSSCCMRVATLREKPILTHPVETSLTK